MEHEVEVAAEAMKENQTDWKRNADGDGLSSQAWLGLQDIVWTVDCVSLLVTNFVVLGISYL